MRHKKVLVLIPARNEARTIASVLDAIRSLYSEVSILVVNDCSTDATSAVAKSRPGVSVVDMPVWLGYGGALQTGYKFALRNGFDAVVQMDADGQHDPSCIGKLLDALDDANIVVGSRFLSPEMRYSMPLFRRIGCYGLSFLARIVNGVRITDPTSGFQALDQAALKVAVLDYYPLDYPDIDVLILMRRHHLKVMEVPVVMYRSEEKVGMHQGFAFWYYGVKMLLSLLIMTFRKA